MGEIRKDKKVANSSTIELELRKQHIYPYKIADIVNIYINTKPYYHISSLFERTGLNNIYKRLSNMHNVNVLDVGCGKKCDNLMSIIKYNLWVGMDIDTSIIEQNKYKPRKKTEWIWCDFTNKWDIDSQKSNLGGNIWLNSNNNWETINQIFDIVLIFNSIHYSAVTETKWINLIEEISKRTKFNSKVYINYLDSNLLNTILDKQIVDKCNYVKKIDPPENSLSTYWIKYYYENTHIKPNIEPVISIDLITEYWNKYGWKLEFLQNKNLNLYDSQWLKYTNCFRLAILTKL